MHTGSQAGSGGQMVGTEPPDCRVLPHVHTGADCALAVHEILEGEAEVGRLVLSRLLHTFERLDEPFAESDELSAEQRSLYEVVDSLEEQGSHFIGDSSFPGSPTVRDSCELLTDQALHSVRLLPVPEEPQLLALRQLVLVVVTLAGLLYLIAYDGTLQHTKS